MGSDPYGLTWITGCFVVPITSDGTDSSSHLPVKFLGIFKAIFI